MAAASQLFLAKSLFVGCRGWMERAIDRIAARRFLSAQPPDFREVDDALSLIVKEGSRAGAVIGRIRALIVGEEERELLISSRSEADGVSVEVRDSGPGLAPATFECVFEAFYTTKPGGLGLGCRSAGQLLKRITEYCR
jgi:hypothetical protein